MEWKPSQMDLAFASFMVDILAEGALFGLTEVGLQFRVYRKERKLVLENPEFLRDPEIRAIFEKMKITFKAAADWTVEVQQ